MLPLFVAIAISFVLCFAFTKSSKLLNGFVRRHDLSAVQSMHTKPTLRLAGVAIFVSIVITNALFEPGSGLLSALLLSSLPLLALGLLEDVGLHQSPSRRLVSSRTRKEFHPAFQVHSSNSCCYVAMRKALYSRRQRCLPEIKCASQKGPSPSSSRK